MSITDKNGVFLTSEEDRTGGWRDHVEELLNGPTSDREKIRKSINVLKIGKARDPDDISEEPITADMGNSIEMLYDLIGKIWDTDEIPTSWKEGNLVKIPESRPTTMQELLRNCADISDWKCPQHNHNFIGKTEKLGG